MYIMSKDNARTFILTQGAFCLVFFHVPVFCAVHFWPKTPARQKKSAGKLPHVVSNDPLLLRSSFSTSVLTFKHALLVRLRLKCSSL
jgi:hypothetical protein